MDFEDASDSSSQELFHGYVSFFLFILHPSLGKFKGQKDTEGFSIALFFILQLVLIVSF